MARLITKVIKSLLPKDLGSLGNLEEAKSAGALVPLDKQEVVPSRREFLKKAGSTAVQTALPRGALATLAKEAIKTPLAKEAIKTPSLPSLSLSGLSSFKNKMDQLVEMAVDEGREMDSELMMDMDEADFIKDLLEMEIGDVEDFEGSFLEDMVDELREKYPEATDQEIFDKFGSLFSGAPKIFANVIPQSKLKYDAGD